MAMILVGWRHVAADALEHVVWAYLSTAHLFKVEFFEWEVCETIHIFFSYGVELNYGFWSGSILGWNSLAVDLVFSKIYVAIFLRWFLEAFCIAGFFVAWKIVAS